MSRSFFNISNVKFAFSLLFFSANVIAGGGFSKSQPDLARAILDHNTPEVARILSRERSSLSEKTFNSGFAASVSLGYADILQVFLNIGAADANLTVPMGELGNLPLLMVAVHAGNLGSTKALLQGKADPNFRHSNGLTALWLASTYGNMEIAQALLASGATPSIPIKTESTPLTQAFLHNHEMVVSLLLQSPKIDFQIEIKSASTFELTVLITRLQEEALKRGITSPTA